MTSAPTTLAPPPGQPAQPASTPLFDEVDVDAVRSCLDADAGAVLSWLADHASEWGASGEDRRALDAAIARS